MVKKIAGTVEKTFDMMDENEDGELDKHEVRETLRKLGVHREVLDEDVESLMEAADTNSDGVITLDEFKNWYLKQKLRAGIRIKKLFDVFDEDRDGLISKDECKSLIAAVNGCEPPIDMINTVMKRSDSAYLLNVDNVIAWFDSENPSGMGNISQKKVKVPKAKVVPASCKVQSDLEQSKEDVDILTFAAHDEEDYIGISFPVGEGWKCKLQ